MVERSGLVIRGARVVSMDRGVGDFGCGDVVVAGGVIQGVGEGLSAPAHFSVIEAEGRIVLPGLIDTHTHLWNGVWRSFAGVGGEGTDYGSLGVGMGPLFAPEDSFQAVLAGSLEMVNAGVTTVHNWSHNVTSPAHADAEIEAAIAAGIRTRFSYGYHWNLAHDELMDLDDVRRVRDQWSGGLVTVGLALRNDTSTATSPIAFPSLSVPPELLKEEMRFARAEGIPLTMHIRNSGPAAYFVDHGFVGPDNLIVHGYHWNEEDWRVLGQAGARVSVSPHTALLWNKTLVPLGDMLAHDVQVSISNDIMNASGTVDLFRTMQLLVINEALRSQTPLPWRRALELATIDGATALGLDAVTGSLTPGKRADLIMLDTDTLSLTPVFDPIVTIVNSAGPGVVDTVLVDGEILKRHGKLTRWDPAQVARRTATMFTALRTRLASA